MILDGLTFDIDANKPLDGHGNGTRTQSELFHSRQRIEKFDTDAAVFWDGDAGTHVFEVVEGVFRVVKCLSGGRSAIPRFYYAGDVITVSLSDPYRFSVEAVTPSLARRFTRKELAEECARSAGMRNHLMEQLCAELAAAQDQMVLLARKTAEERVCSLLLVIARRMAVSRHRLSVIEIPMGRPDIADYLGLTKETVSRTMGKLTSIGVISQVRRHGVVIHKLETLSRYSGDGDHDDPRAFSEVPHYPAALLS